MKYFISILFCICLSVLLCCNCTSFKNSINELIEKNDLYFLSDNSSIHLYKQDKLFEYNWWYWDGHKYGNGHWNFQNNQLNLVFDIEPSVNRLLEGWIFGDTIILLQENNSLIQMKHINHKGDVNTHEVFFKNIAEKKYKKLVSELFLHDSSIE